MPLSWNEIKRRAVAFSNEWKNTSREEADAKPFLIEFLHIFGISQKRDSEEFVLSDQCENEFNQSDNSTKEKDSYISCKESDLCWYIMYLNEKGLTLQYLGRGNTLTYKRVDEHNLPLSRPSGAMAGK
ncbi:MAG: hypothetical protein IM591_01455 [Chitinophagaceae bacterium]|nr:hypothetical protein [Flavobacterium sp.]MCA6460936.1 hypothetical protein [Chitinophagaceae bacterium]MCA6469043.1 hypothetical protein [Chitinophagaceae bacterium]